MDVKDEGAGCYFTIKQVGNKIIIDGGCHGYFTSSLLYNKKLQ